MKKREPYIPYRVEKRGQQIKLWANTKIPPPPRAFQMLEINSSIEIVVAPI